MAFTFLYWLETPLGVDRVPWQSHTNIKEEQYLKFSLQKLNKI